MLASAHRLEEFVGIHKEVLRSLGRTQLTAILNHGVNNATTK